MSISKELRGLRRDRGTFESHWQECADYILPRKNDITTNATSPGNKKMTKVYDSTGITANEEMASALYSMLTNPSSIWFLLRTLDYQLNSIEQVKFWLYDASRKMHDVLSASNFHQELPEVYLDLGCFGSAGMIVEDDIEKVVNFKSFPISDLFFKENASGVVSEVYRVFKVSSDIAIELFGKDNLPSEDKNKEGDLEFVHVVRNRKKFNPDASNPKNMPVESSFWSEKSDKLVLESGYREWPLATPRWTKLTREIYGRSPGMKALPDIKMLNEMSKTVIKAAQKAVDPPLLVNHKEVVLPIRTFPGGLNYAKPSIKGRDPIQPILNSGQIGLGLELENQRRAMIRQAFFLDQLSLPEVKTHVSVPEFSQRNEERLRKLGSIIGRIQNELLRPIINRVFNIMMRKGMFLPPPEEMLNSSLGVEYVSPIANAQKFEEANSILKSLSAVSPLLEVNQNILDNIDHDVAFRDISTIANMPVHWLRSFKDVIALREDRIKRQQEATAIQEGVAVSDALSNLSRSIDSGR